MKKIIKMINNFFIGALIALLLLLLVINSFSKDSLFKIGNYSMFSVNGESMEPKINNGDFIAIDRRGKNNYVINDVICFWMYNGSENIIVTHQIVDINEDIEISYITKGINNNGNDIKSVKEDEIIGLYKGFRVPLLGFIVSFANTQIGNMLLVVIPLGGILLVSIYELIKEICRKRGES